MSVIREISSAIINIIHETEMGYTSIVFFICVIIFLGVLFLLRGQREKQLWILAANLVFYAWAGTIAALVIVFATAIIVYLTSRKIEEIYSRSDSKKVDPELKKIAKRYLLLSLILILAVWIYVKAGKLFDLREVGSLGNFVLLKTIIVPLGISYYSLSAIGYLLDVFWKKTIPEHNFLVLFDVMIYFPHIVQGPISKYRNLVKQMNQIPKFDYTRVCYGLQLMLYGYFKKMVLADRIAIFTTEVFENYENYQGVIFLVALLLSTFQIYMDFSGCVDIALGISQAAGINLDQNFRQPFFSKSAEEFWRRWHITLGAWFKDYVYFPILVSPHYKKISSEINKKYGASIAKVFNTVVPLGTVWILTGLWHGTGWNYFLWGIYYGTIIITSTLIGNGYQKLSDKLGINTETKGFRLFQCLRTGFIFMMGRLLTVPVSLSASWFILHSLLATFNPWVLWDGTLLEMGLDFADFVIIVLGLVIILIISSLQEKGSVRDMIAKRNIFIRWLIYYGAIFAILILGVYGAGYDASAFIYGQF